MFSTLRGLFVLAAGTLVSGLLFAPLAFAVNAGDGAAGGPTRPALPTTRPPDPRWRPGSGH